MAGEPATSFLLQKITNTHNSQGYTGCIVQLTGATEPCGDPMPPIGEPLCLQGGGDDRVGVIARWVAQGAADN